MMRRVRALAACSLVLLVSFTARGEAQEAVTITGRVSSETARLRGASVRIPDLGLDATTDAQGRYSIIIPSSRVRGQSVTITARYLRYRPQTASVRLVGGALVQDFLLVPAAEAPADPGRPVPAEPSAPLPAADSSRQGRVVDAPSRAAQAPVQGDAARIAASDDTRLRTVDGSAFVDLAGSVDVPSALAARLAGVEVRSSSALGGTSAVAVRGQRTIVGLTQPLVVVNGIPIDDANVASISQRTGRGGFDFGSALSDLNPEDVASVELLRGPAAAMRYGGRAANGVLLVTTRSGRGLSGFAISANQQFSYATPLKLPEYQNEFGQGLGGAFAFFDGRGGGVDDSVSQSWGPALLGQPIPQASLTEAGRAEVRPWVPRPDNVRDYFERGRVLATNAAAQGSNESGQFRLSLSNRDYKGVTPQSSLTRRAATLTSSYQPTPRLELSGDVQYHGTRGEDRPGTGADESNPVSVFPMMGRQVDVAALRDRLRDASQRQISWNYSGHNNPFFAAIENDNSDQRTRLLGGGTASYMFSNWLRGTARAGADRYSETRRLTVASGWMGGFPYFAGDGDFSTGGREDAEVEATRTNAELWLRATPPTTGANGFAFSLGAGRRDNELRTTASGTDRLPNATPPAVQRFRADGQTSFLAGGVDATLLDFATLSAVARRESSSLLSASSAQLYPSALASIDLVRANPSLRGRVDALKIRGGWSRSGTEASAALLQQLGIATGATASAVGTLVAPELTSGWELGGEVRAFAGRLAADVGYYNERSENLILPASAGFLRSGTVSNKGIEAQAELTPLRFSRFEWRVGASFARNTSNVQSLGAGTGSVSLAPIVDGASVEARTGSPLGTLTGTTYLRDAAGQLLLRNGLPLPDSVAGARVLGASAPSWIAGVSSAVRFMGLDLSVLFDIRRGGRLFSTSNRAGAFAGVLAETSFRPDTGLLIAGVDVVTRQANVVHVSTEDYYHALGAIAERWVYDAGFVKLREARASFALPLHAVGLHAQSLRVALIGRNLTLWSNAPNIDPEFVLSTAPARGLEMGQLPTARSVGVQVSLTP